MSRTGELQRGMVAAALAFGVAACGAKFDQQGNGPRGKGDAGSSAAGQSSGGVGTSGSAGGAGAGASSGSPTGTTSPPDGGVTLSPDGGVTFTPEGGTRASRGCGLGTSCLPGNDLAPPAPTEGFQIVTPPGMFTLQPGQETFPNYCQILPNTAEFDVGTIQSWMTPGSSHELFVYRGSAGGAPAGGTPGTCSSAGSTWMYAASIAGVIVELKMPDGVGMPVQPGTPIVLTMHFVNFGTSPAQPQVKLNLFRTSNLQYEAGAMLSFNTMIDIPAATATAPGSQTVTGTCTVPAGANFFAVGTHTNGRATVADVNLVSGGTTTNIVHTTNWQYPDVGVWTAPPFLTMHNGDSLTYSCAYSNSGAARVTVGETQASNEMCMAVGYYFPAGSASCE